MGFMASDIDWIAVDWGTSNLRAWAMAGDCAIGSVSTGTGMGGLARDAFEPALIGAIGGWLAAGRRTPVIACGMVGARQGWVEVPYVAVPSEPLRFTGMRTIATDDARITVTIVHGMSQPKPADVMRGEETQLAGLLSLEPGFAGMACLPGTHAKWVTMRGGQVVAFRTFMTGEMFAVLAEHSILRHSIGDAGEPDLDAFDSAVRDAATDAAGLAANLFAIRASSLLGESRPAAARSRLSGLLVGIEVAAMLPLFENAKVAIIGQHQLGELYARAIGLLGGSSRVLDAERCTLAGLAVARRLVVKDSHP